MKVGLDTGLIGADLFTMLLLIPLVTTAMISPLMSLFAPRARWSTVTVSHIEAPGDAGTVCFPER